MTGAVRAIHAGADAVRPSNARVHGGFTTIDAERYARIAHVDQLDPFLMSIVSDSDCWLFVGSNGPFTAGRRSPDSALFPYQTVDKILRHPTTSGALTALLVTRDGRTSLWEPWQDSAATYRIERNLYKRVDGTAALFEEINHDLGMEFRWRVSACERYGVVRRSELVERSGEAADVRYLDGWHQMIPPGVDQNAYARLSYLASAYMRHERLPDVPLAVYALNAAISDRAEPSESLRVATAWSAGHDDPTILLSDRQVAAFRRGEDVSAEHEVRGEIGAYLAVGDRRVAPGERCHWYTVGDTRLDHPGIDRLRLDLGDPDAIMAALVAAMATDREGLVRRVADADGVQHTADEAATANHFSNVLFNVMRGGTFAAGYEVPLDDLADYLREQDRVVADANRAWVEALPDHITIQELRRHAEAEGDPQLRRLVAAYLPLTYSRRHGDPSRPWNRFMIRLRDGDGRPVRGYEGNWRDIFQNWEALGESYPAFVPAFVTVFLNASTADGYNPYRITRAGIDWEVVDPDDPWSHIGYWGDHQIVYLLRLLESQERHLPGSLAAALDDRVHAYANVPYRIAPLAALLDDPRSTIEFDAALHDELVAAADELGADGRLLRDEHGQVRLVTLGEKLLVPVLVKLSNLVPGGGLWLNTQRPEWNDANNALAGWGLSVVTVCAMRRYLAFLQGIVPTTGSLALSVPVARLLRDLRTGLQAAGGPLDDAARYAILEDLGSAGEAHRNAVYAGAFGEPVEVPAAEVRALLATARDAVEATIRANRRPDGLYHSYNLLDLDGRLARIDHLGPMLEGQVAALDSGLLRDDEAVTLLRALRASDMYRADQHSYLLYPDREFEPFTERNTLAGEPPIDDPRLFVRDPSGRWHFQADLSTVADVERALDAIEGGLAAATRAVVLDLWRTTFGHDEFTGRSGTFFMFEGLGSIYWHMVAKLVLAVQGARRRATEPDAAAALARLHDDVRDGLGFRKSPEVYGAFPTDPYSHSPRHRGAQQPGMTGQVKEQILARFGELGIHVADGCITFEPDLLHPDDRPRHDGGAIDFTYCATPVRYRTGDSPSIEIERADGSVESIAGRRLDRAASAGIFDRTGSIRRVTVILPAAELVRA